MSADIEIVNHQPVQKITVVASGGVGPAGAAAQGIDEAPEDGSPYSRQDAAWVATPGGGDLLAANDLSDLDNAGTARTNLGLGTAATTAATAYATAAQGSTADSAASAVTTLANSLGTASTADADAFDAAGSAASAQSASQPLATALTNTTASYTTEEETKLGNIEAGATADQTGAQIKSAYEGLADTNAFDDAAVDVLGTALQPADIDVPINALTGTSHTLALSNINASNKRGVVTCDNGSAVTLTVPPNADVAFPVGSAIDVLGIGAGIVTVAAGAGVTINATPTLVFRAQHSGATMLKLAANTWQLVGDLAEA